jgi:hypothetical protein
MIANQWSFAVMNTFSWSGLLWVVGLIWFAFIGFGCAFGAADLTADLIIRLKLRGVWDRNPKARLPLALVMIPLMPFLATYNLCYNILSEVMPWLNPYEWGYVRKIQEKIEHIDWYESKEKALRVSDSPSIFDKNDTDESAQTDKGN